MLFPRFNQKNQSKIMNIQNITYCSICTIVEHFLTCVLLWLLKEIGQNNKGRKYINHEKEYCSAEYSLPVVCNIYSQLSFMPLAVLCIMKYSISERRKQGGIIQAIQCQIAFHTCSIFQPHQEGCLKRQSAFAPTKYIYNYLKQITFFGYVSSKECSGLL